MYPSCLWWRVWSTTPRSWSVEAGMTSGLWLTHSTSPGKVSLNDTTAARPFRGGERWGGCCESRVRIKQVQVEMLWHRLIVQQVPTSRCQLGKHSARPIVCVCEGLCMSVHTGLQLLTLQICFISAPLRWINIKMVYLSSGRLRSNKLNTPSGCFSMIGNDRTSVTQNGWKLSTFYRILFSSVNNYKKVFHFRISLLPVHVTNISLVSVERRFPSNPTKCHHWFGRNLKEGQSPKKHLMWAIALVNKTGWVCVWWVKKRHHNISLFVTT